MKVTKTHIFGPLIIESQIFFDNRGYFLEEYNLKKYKEIGISKNFVQDNQSYSVKNVIRGLHIQLGSASQGKLAYVVKGEVLDVAVDCRLESSTFGQHVSVVLSEENKKQFWIPRGFAHGLSVLSDVAIFAYKCDNYYSEDKQFTVIYNDADLKIDWGVNTPIVSKKDCGGHKFSELKAILVS